MKISKKDETYFSDKMVSLAKKFNAVMRRYEIAHDKKEMKALDKIANTAQKALEEFENKGYTDQQWNKLLVSSGAAQITAPYKPFEAMGPQ